MEATPVPRASLEIRCGGIRLQSCQSTLSFDAVGLEFFFSPRSSDRVKGPSNHCFFCFNQKAYGMGVKSSTTKRILL
jgi:hypothetical protein